MHLLAFAAFRILRLFAMKLPMSLQCFLFGCSEGHDLRLSLYSRALLKWPMLWIWVGGFGHCEF